MTFILVIFFLLILLVVMGLVIFAGWLSTKGKISYVLSPYAKIPVRPLLSANFMTLQKVYDFVEDLPGYDNRMFNFRRTVFCRETGRIFPNCIDWKGTVHLDWTFLHKRHQGNWISWGSLKEDQKRDIKERHESLNGFQTEFSCPFPKPQDITEEYIYLKPGPLYVDLMTYHLLGWQSVPDTELEVLAVQLPKKPLVKEINGP